MRKELFNAIKAKLASDVPEVQHIDLWNHNVEFVEQEEGWARPAVFVEFGKIEWSPFQGGSQRGKGLVTIHLVTDWATVAMMQLSTFATRCIQPLTD